MKFDKVQVEHISLAIKDFKGKSLLDGFKASAQLNFDVGNQILSKLF